MRRAVRWATLVAALAGAAPAAADDTAQRDAEARFEEGLARVRAHDLEGALQSFRQATALMRKPAIVWNLALTEEKTNHPVDALAHFKEYLRQLPADDPDRPRAQKHIDALNAAAGHIEVVAPIGAAITVDGTHPLGTAPLGDVVDVLPGHHDIEARLGAVVKTVGIDALLGATTLADFRGMDAAMTGPGATAPQPDGAAASGERAAPDTGQGTGNGGFFTPRVTTAAILAGVAVVALGTGVGFGVASSSNQSTAAGYASQHPLACSNTAPDPAVCSKWQSAVSAQNTDTTASIVSYIAAGAFATGAVLAYVLWGTERKSVSTMWFVPTASPAGVGLGAGGRF
jgi:hypothetical protein